VGRKEQGLDCLGSLDKNEGMERGNNEHSRIIREPPDQENGGGRDLPARGLVRRGAAKGGRGHGGGRGKSKVRSIIQGRPNNRRRERDRITRC